MQGQSSCLDENTLAALGEGTLPSEARERTARHLDGCARCRALLAAVGQLDSQPAPGAAASPLAQAPQAPALPAELPPGTAVGRFIVLHPVGRGGMGSVYAAYDPQLDRRVALKLLRPEVWGTDESEEGRARLLREAQAMARLSHPHVVTVYEVGLAGSQLFIAMEYVEGQTLRAWLKAGARSWSEVVRVFADAGKGLAAAHAKGLVHRDFKPENVLVGTDGRVRVGDFGLVSPSGELPDAGRASAPHAQGASLASTATRSGVLLGTPGYMAPEQYEGNREVDARADQYAFCTALYEALYGQRPFPATTREALREAVLAGEVPEPPRASGVPARVRQALLRGLSRAPEARFAQLEPLLAALEASLVSNRSRGVLAAAAVAAVLLAALGTSSWLHERAQLCSGAPAQLAGTWDEGVRTRARAALLATGLPYAQDTWSRVERGLDAYTRDWASMHREACEATALRKEQSEQLLDLRMQCLEARRSRLQAVTRLFSAAVTPAVLNKSVELVAGLEPLAACADAEALGAAFPPPAPALRPQVATLMGHLDTASTYNHVGRLPEALKLAEEVLKASGPLAYPPLTARAWVHKAQFHLELGQFKEAEPVTRETARAGALARSDRTVAQAWLFQLWSQAAQGKYAEAQALLPVAEVAVLRAGDTPELRNLLESYTGSLYFGLDEPQKAVPHLRRALEVLEQQQPLPVAAKVRAALQRRNLSSAIRRGGQPEEAWKLLARSLADLEQELGAAHPRVGSLYAEMGLAAASAGRLGEALGYHQRALNSLEKALPADSTELALSYGNLAFALSELGRFAEATQQQERALGIWVKALGEGSYRVGENLLNLADFQEAQGNHAEAEQRYLRALRIFEKELGAEHTHTAIALVGLASVERSLRRYPEAERHVQRALGIWEKAARKGSEEHVRALLAMGELLLLQPSRAGAARPYLERALKLTPEQGWDPSIRGSARFALARLRWSLGERAPALELARAAQQDHGRAENYRARRAEPVVKAWLAEREPRGVAGSTAE